MININHIILHQRIVHIIDGNRNLHGIRNLGFIKCFFRWYMAEQHTGNLLFQYFIAGDLKITVNGEIHIMAGNGVQVGILVNLQNFSQVVHIHRLFSISPLKVCLHILLNAGFSNNWCGIVFFCIFFLQFLQFLGRCLSGISDNVGKINGIFILAFGIFNDIHPLQIIPVFLNDGHRFLA